MPEEAMLLSTLRQLAKEMDEGGGSRTTALWLSAQKDLRRVLNGASVSVPGASASKAQVKKAAKVVQPPEPEKPVRNDLVEFKRERGIAS
jgi:hypothetical protein